jgi:hypothetical protein
LYREGEEIEFIETEIAHTGQRRDIMVKVDGETIQITEFMAKALNDEKLLDIYDYHESTRRDPEYKQFHVKTGVFSIAEPTHGKNTVEIDKNITFRVGVKFAKSKNAWKVLNILTYKSFTQEKLSYDEAVDLLVLPDMYMGKNETMKMPIKQFMTMGIVLMGSVKFPSSDLRKKVFVCEKLVLARFFSDDELVVMVDMLKTVSRDSEIARKIEEYGPGYDEIYMSGIADGMSKGFADGMSKGFADGRSKGFADAKLDHARNLLADGFDVETISRNIGISIEELEELKRKL